MKHRKHSRRGTALIEFAGSLILLTSVFAGIFQLGYTLSSYNSLVNAVRTGARYASLQAGRPRTDNAELTKAVKNLVAYGELAPAAGAPALLPGFDAENVSVSFSPAGATVAVSGFKLDALFSRMSLDGRPSVTFPVAGGAER